MADSLTTQRLAELRLLRGTFEKGSSERNQAITVAILILTVGVVLLVIPFLKNVSISEWETSQWACIPFSVAAIALGIHTLRNLGGAYEFTAEGITEKRANGKDGSVVIYDEVKSIQHHASKIGGEFLHIVTHRLRMSVVLTPEIFEALEKLKHPDNSQTPRPSPPAPEA